MTVTESTPCALTVAHGWLNLVSTAAVTVAITANESSMKTLPSAECSPQSADK